MWVCVIWVAPSLYLSPQLSSSHPGLHPHSTNLGHHRAQGRPSNLAGWVPPTADQPLWQQQVCADGLSQPALVLTVGEYQALPGHNYCWWGGILASVVVAVGAVSGELELILSATGGPGMFLRCGWRQDS